MTLLTRAAGPFLCPIPRRSLTAVCLLTATSFFLAPVAWAQVGGGYSLVASFGGGNGAPKSPYAPLVQDAAGSFFSAAQRGAGGAGAVFSLSPTGTLARFYQFRGGDGAVPVAPLLRDAAGNFYGTTEQGGFYGYGTVFRLAASGSGYTIGYDFGSSNDDAATPNSALVLGPDGTLYGTTTEGGYDDFGTIFQITTDGTLTILHDFRGTDGTFPDASLIQANDGQLYGTTSGGGPYDAGTVFRLGTDDALTTLYSFPDKVDGLQPEAPLIQANDGNLYGTTYYGGTAGGGTVFALATDGSGFATLHNFVGGDNDGANPVAALLQACDGTFYGTTAFGGARRVGTVYRLALGLPGAAAAVSARVKGEGTATFGVRNARFLISRTGADLSQPLAVVYTLGGTAVNGVDYRALSGVATILAGETRVKIPVAPLGVETTAKTVTLTLSAPAAGSYTLEGSAGGTVQITP